MRYAESGDPLHILEVVTHNMACHAGCESDRQTLIKWIEEGQ
jgi:hypothetical protein